MHSSLPFFESMYGWFHLVMRDTVKVKCVCVLSTLLCLSLKECRMCPLCLGFFFFPGWSGVEGEFGVCVFICVVSSAIACPFSRDGLFVTHRHKIIRLVVVCL
ncbi:hypothetical protein XENOCAPTIV_030983 [Xenoophorus captivus]|uniref:Uncharacterized protein n=1 Tax=Xenoophorus captivus TaxID=1517983 RepID=A0ABV0REI5_9TELE